MGEDFKPGGGQIADKRFQHKRVLENTAAQADPVQRRHLAQPLGELRKNGNQPVMEAAADGFRSCLSLQIFDHGFEQGSGSNLPFVVVHPVKIEWISIRLRRCTRQRFQFHRRLGFVIHVIANPDQGRDGVK